MAGRDRMGVGAVLRTSAPRSPRNTRLLAGIGRISPWIEDANAEISFEREAAIRRV